MDTEQVIKVVVVSVLSLIFGCVVAGLGLKAYGALMDTISPGAWLAITVVTLVVGAAIVGFLFGAAPP